ncbi:holo-ACP synthase [Litorivivens sp.]|uniref:holo-ACP synthase n=1 Tax=Litorivivens sp. TaxID=2020868 RepID=UPI000C37797D|nr:holo-ACP synthase [Spongiibacteraceae bacterium]
MISGIGTDLIYIERIDATWQRFGERFLKRLLSENEYRQFESRGRDVRYLAKRFAAKEAAAKALGVGIGARARLCEIEVLNNPLGKPELSFYGAAADTIREQGIVGSHIALTDESDLAQAFVVFER